MSKAGILHEIFKIKFRIELKLDTVKRYFLLNISLEHYKMTYIKNPKRNNFLRVIREDSSSSEYITFKTLKDKS